jgi:phosphoglycolate phosphatase
MGALDLTAHTLVLFDIDGTLVDPGGAGRRSLTKVFFQLFSMRDTFARITTAGKTDIQIIKEGLSLHGLPSGDGILASILSGYVENLKREINTAPRSIMPGVVELLDGLNAMDGYWPGLLTGNIEQGARIKLGAFGLNGYFPVGAFGDDSEDRNKLLPIAIERFRKTTNVDINYSDCIVIGDTPLDVECSRPFGATSIAVSTGSYTYESLLETGADYVLRDLTRAMDLIEEFKVR